MNRIALVYGGIAGTVIIGTTIVGSLLMPAETLARLEWLGYLVMFVALALVFVGVKRHRDEELGGVIRFGTALKVGLAIALVATVVYVAAWEATQAATGYRFTEEYAAAYMADVEASGATEAEVAAARADVEVVVERMRNPVFRVLITASEILPVGVLVALLSAVVLRRPEAFRDGVRT